MRIALIKTSSMGDVIHALPVVSDLLDARPDAVIDWVVEESFADLPRLHPGVREVIPVAVRRWRKALGAPATWSEIRAVRRRLREGRYDLALDLQGLVKSAVVARWTRSPIAGFARDCVREPLAALAYTRAFHVGTDLHAIERLRLLAAQALGYALKGPPRFALAAPARALPWRPAAPYAVFLHATSRAEKQWPAERWQALGAALAAQGIAAVLPWGSTAEQVEAQALAESIDAAVASVSTLALASPTATAAASASAPPPPAVVAPRMALADCARLLADAEVVVGVDTGLTHLSAALDARTVALFAATPAWRFGPYWTDRARSLGADGVWPDVDEVLSAIAALRAAAERRA